MSVHVMYAAVYFFSFSAPKIWSLQRIYTTYTSGRRPRRIGAAHSGAVPMIALHDEELRFATLAMSFRMGDGSRVFLDDDGIFQRHYGDSHDQLVEHDGRPFVLVDVGVSIPDSEWRFLERCNERHQQEERRLDAVLGGGAAERPTSAFSRGRRWIIGRAAGRLRSLWPDRSLWQWS